MSKLSAVAKLLQGIHSPSPNVGSTFIIENYILKYIIRRYDALQNVV